MAWAIEGESKRYFGYTFYYQLYFLLPQNWHLPLGGCQKTSKPKHRKIYYFLQQVRTLRIFPQTVSTQQQELENFKPKGTCILQRGLSRGEFQHRLGAKVSRIQALVDWDQEGQYLHSVLYLYGSLWVPAELKDIVLCVFLEGGLELCLITGLLFDKLFCVPLRSWITETCSRASVGLRSQNSRGCSGSSYVKKAIHSWLCFSGDPLTYLLYISICGRRITSPSHISPNTNDCRKIPNHVHHWSDS